MADFSDQTLTGPVLLDGNTFTRIRFKDATLTFTGIGRAPKITDCSMTDCRFAFSGAAGETVNFLRSMCVPGSKMREIVLTAIPELKG